MEGRESEGDDEMCGRSKWVNTPELIRQRVRFMVRVTMLTFKGNAGRDFVEWGCDGGHWHAHTRGLTWEFLEVVGTVKQVHCSRRRLLRRRLEFHVCTINKSTNMNNVWVLCFDLLTRPIMPFKVTHRKEVTHSNGSYERKSRGRKLDDEMGRG